MKVVDPHEDVSRGPRKALGRRIGRGNTCLMLREHINSIMVRWNPRERPGSRYDPDRFLETPEQARKLIQHLEAELTRARAAKNRELASEIQEILARVESLSRKFFRWEMATSRAVDTEELREIRKLPLGF